MIEIFHFSWVKTFAEFYYVFFDILQCNYKNKIGPKLCNFNFFQSKNPDFDGVISQNEKSVLSVQPQITPHVLSCVARSVWTRTSV